MTDINLFELTGDGAVRNLTGHERGVEARVRYDLEKLDEVQEPVRVIVPESVYTLTPSFFQGMFAESVRKLGETFLTHYRFDASALIMRQVQRGISSANMQRGSLLQH
ncbi:hypothetical protein GGR34_003292 [Microvirga flocculans]|uniref:DUF4325 domain-containing protein n=1 Tax=Microvirga flocculans TaxID=217168 RepID=A0A7W6IHK6_9HYPH|nr:hypothetical protein [Microvirga flocculans]MBB4041614.1 hypothetical protein [Microvirga flocculans]